MDTSQRTQEIGMAQSTDGQFNKSSGRPEDLEGAILALLQNGESSLEEQPQGLLDRLLARALDEGCVEAASLLLDAGASLDNAGPILGLTEKSADFKRRVEMAIEISVTSNSAPVDADDNMARAKKKLRQSLAKLHW